MNSKKMTHTKSTIKFSQRLIDKALSINDPIKLKQYLVSQKIKLSKMVLMAQPDMIRGTMLAHKKLCKSKNMHEKAAFGHEPALFYGLALSGECGELANNLTKAARTGNSKKKFRDAVLGEIADVFIYTILLAYMVGVDPHEIVEEKNKIVIQRAKNGYYGGPIQAGMPGSLNKRRRVKSLSHKGRND